MSTSLTINGIECTELYGSGEVSFGDSGSGSRVFKCAWSNRETVMNYFLGLVVDDASGGYSSQEPRARHPEFSGLIVSNVTCAGMGVMSIKGTESYQYEYAKITVNYTGRKGSASTGDTVETAVLATHQLDFAGEFLLQGLGSYNFGTKLSGGNSTLVGKPIAKQIGVLVPQLTHTFTRNGLTKLPIENITSYLGKVNSTNFTLYDGQKISAGYMLFVGASNTREVTVEGTGTFSVTYNYLQRKVPWNCIWSPADADWVYADPVPYASADIQALLR